LLPFCLNQTERIIVQDFSAIGRDAAAESASLLAARTCASPSVHRLDSAADQLTGGTNGAADE